MEHLGASRAALSALEWKFKRLVVRTVDRGQVQESTVDDKRKSTFVIES